MLVLVWFCFTSGIHFWGLVIYVEKAIALIWKYSHKALKWVNFLNCRLCKQKSGGNRLYRFDFKFSFKIEMYALTMEEEYIFARGRLFDISSMLIALRTKVYQIQNERLSNSVFSVQTVPWNFLSWSIRCQPYG